MSILITESQPCVIISFSSVPDGEGGEITQYTETDIFNAVVTPTSYKNDTKRIANTEIPAAAVKVMFPKSVDLKLNSIFKTLNDGKTYRVSTDGTKSVKSSAIPYKLTTAEEWSVPDE